MTAKDADCVDDVITVRRGREGARIRRGSESDCRLVVTLKLPDFELRKVRSGCSVLSHVHNSAFSYFHYFLGHLKP